MAISGQHPLDVVDVDADLQGAARATGAVVRIAERCRAVDVDLGDVGAAARGVPGRRAPERSSRSPAARTAEATERR